MRVVIQRVKEAEVEIDKEIYSSIQRGLLVFVGIENSDNDEEIEWLAKKIVNLRIFDDEKGVMNKSVIDISGDILCISQFTLHASTKKGNRPSYIKAAKPEFSTSIYEKLCEMLTIYLTRAIGKGKFGAEMKVKLINDGPVTIAIDSKNRE